MDQDIVGPVRETSAADHLRRLFGNAGEFGEHAVVHEIFDEIHGADGIEAGVREGQGGGASLQGVSVTASADATGVAGMCPALPFLPARESCFCAVTGP